MLSEWRDWDADPLGPLEWLFWSVSILGGAVLIIRTF